MKPERSTEPRLEQPRRRSRWVTGGTVAALALALAAGIAGPASAAIPITQVAGQTVTVPPHGSASSIALCPAGQSAVSGGWSTAAAGPVPGVSERLSPDEWFVIFDNPTDFAVTAFSIAYCTP